MITVIFGPALRIKTVQNRQFLQYIIHAILGFTIVFTTGFVGAMDSSIDSWSTSKPLPRLRVSLNGRYLVTEDGEPFFWLGDTKYFITNVEQEDSPHFRK